MTRSATDRERAKADRHDALLREAARLFADRGFSGVSLEDLGAAVGVSGPAVYRHFSGKQALLAAILVGVSERLHAGGTEVAAAHDTAADRLVALARFHVAFALSEADVDPTLRQVIEVGQPHSHIHGVVLSHDRHAGTKTNTCCLG